MSLDVRASVRRGDFVLDAELRADPGEVVVLAGPNGAGKTTLLRAIAGLEPIDAGRIAADGRVLDDAGRRWVPPERRGVGLVPQGGYLFEHLSVVDNVAFGPRCRGVRRDPARDEAVGWLERVGLAHLADRRPATLSGGEARRVALVRTLAARPDVLLMDEPFAGLDATAHAEVRARLRGDLASHAGVHVVVVHEPLDALAIADRLWVIEDGRIVQSGTPEEVRLRPRTPYVADLVGLNLFRGRWEDGGVALPDGRIVAPGEHPPGTDVVAVFHPHAVALHPSEPSGSPRNVWRGTVADLLPDRDRLRVRVEGAVLLTAEVTRDGADALGLRPGAEVWASVKATEVEVYPA